LRGNADERGDENIFSSLPEHEIRKNDEIYAVVNFVDQI
jgi:hypothetical protein